VATLAAPLVAAASVVVSIALGWRGVDAPAQLYRVAAFRAHGLALWDSQWFGGHWTLNYSLLYPPVAATIGVATVTVLAAAAAALAFERLASAHLGRGATPAALVFAVSTVVSSAIGQWPFLAGEALGLAACWTASRRRWTAAAALALATSLTSPLAGLFVAMAMVAWLLASRGATRPWAAIAVALAAAGPIAAAAILFPGQGPMPYPVEDYGWEMIVAAAIWLLAGRTRRVLRAGVLVFAAVATLAVLVPSPLGGNVGRMEDALALPVAIGLLWPLAASTRPLVLPLRRLVALPRRLVPRLSPGARPLVLPLGPAARWLVLPLVAVPLVLSQWGPAWGAMTSDPGQASTHRSFYAPLLAALAQASAGQPAGRVEVIPTEFHWEADYVAPVMPLARGWERQLDEADNPLFYGGASHLEAASYRSWLVDNGVRYVAVPHAPLDFAGTAEARLVAAGVPGLDLIWQTAEWRLYRVDGSAGIVAAPARLLRQNGDRVVVIAPAPGPVLVRVRYSPDWQVGTGQGCVARGPSAAGGGDWVEVEVPRAETFSLRLALFSGRRPCPAGR
jgi:hypothetical protein